MKGDRITAEALVQSFGLRDNAPRHRRSRTPISFESKIDRFPRKSFISHFVGEEHQILCLMHKEQEENIPSLRLPPGKQIVDHSPGILRGKICEVLEIFAAMEPRYTAEMELDWAIRPVYTLMNLAVVFDEF